MCACGSLRKIPGVLLYHFLDGSLDLESLTQPETHPSPLFFLLDWLTSRLGDLPVSTPLPIVLGL